MKGDFMWQKIIETINKIKGVVKKFISILPASVILSIIVTLTIYIVVSISRWAT